MVNDPIADMLVRLKNAGEAGKPVVDVPFSGLKLRIANILLEEGYVASVVKNTKKGKGGTIEIGILFDENKRPRLSGLIRVSRPSRRVYSKSKEIRPVQQGHGIMILSTPKGVMTDAKARKENVGGEVLCKIW
jgi:small subunit ribosomal protein S8